MAEINKRCCVQCDNGGAGSLDDQDRVLDLLERWDEERLANEVPVRTGDDEVVFADEAEYID